tara:strand:+ start:1918 stop:2055 length:138 start_codon:yes stop_codon:yes gene_type:complete
MATNTNAQLATETNIKVALKGTFSLTCFNENDKIKAANRKKVDAW